MNNLFVSYELAVKLKKFGFNAPCYSVIFTTNNILRSNEVHVYSESKNWNEQEFRVSAPLYEQVIDWLRDEHNIEIVLFPKLYAGGISYCFDCIKMNQRSTSDNLDNLTKGIYVLYNSSKECYVGAFNEALEMINE